MSRELRRIKQVWVLNRKRAEITYHYIYLENDGGETCDPVFETEEEMRCFLKEVKRAHELPIIDANNFPNPVRPIEADQLKTIIDKHATDDEKYFFFRYISGWVYEAIAAQYGIPLVILYRYVKIVEKKYKTDNKTKKRLQRVIHEYFFFENN